MLRTTALALAAVVLLNGCDTDPTFVENPPTDWEVEGGDETGGLKPRNQVRVGREALKDNGQQRDGTATGVVWFGRPQNGNQHGAANSVARTTFACGAQGGDCEVVVQAAGGTGAPYAAHESLVLTLEKLNDAGQPTGEMDREVHPGNLGTKDYTLTVPGCGTVRLTLSFSETVNAENPSGIQSRFTSHIVKYGCQD